MKYIVFELNAKEMIFIFPRDVDHDRMAEGCEAIRWGGEQNWRRSLRDGEPIAAGFIDASGNCYGHSKTLGIKSRGEADTKLLRGIDVVARTEQEPEVEEPDPLVFSEQDLLSPGQIHAIHSACNYYSGEEFARAIVKATVRELEKRKNKQRKVRS